MSYIRIGNKIDGGDVAYWHKQYIERRNKTDELAAEIALKADYIKRLEEEQGFHPSCLAVDENVERLEEENEALKDELKRLPDKARWIYDNASHHSKHWLKTQLYGLAREYETGYINVGTKEFYRVDALLTKEESE